MTTEALIELTDHAEINAGGVLVRYSKTEAALAALRDKYAGATFDLTTTKGDKEARAARLELTTLRTSLEKRRKELKKPALEFGQKIDSEAARITGEIQALENPIDAQIVADEARRAAAKAERERMEAERVAAHQARLAAMRACVARSHGLPSARIANGIAQVEAIDLGVAAWEEFAGEAATTKLETLAAMREMFESAKAREDEQARVELQRLENERIAAENRAAAERLAEQQRVLDAQAAAIKAQQDEIEARRVAEVKRLELERSRAVQIEVERIAREQAEQVSAQRIRDEQIEAQIRQLASSDAAIVAALAVAPATEDTGARLTLGQINERLAPVMTTSVAGLAQLGFEPVAQVKASRFYRECDLPAIGQAIARHAIAVTAGVAA